MKKILASLLLTFASVLVINPVNVFARDANGATNTTLGADISYPQCGKVVPINQAFGVVGVNGGIATTTNPCLSYQLLWASRSLGGTAQDKIQLYVNTANPGGLNTASWPRSNTDSAGTTVQDPYGTCTGSDTTACAWQYGWNRSLEDVRDRFQTNANTAAINPLPSNYVWWLDVETGNTWKLSGSDFDMQSNKAVLEGMTAYFESLQARVGLYSTAYQWGKIVGNSVNANSNLVGRANWRPGGANLSTAKQACIAPPLTVNGSVVMTQFISKNLDYNYSCI